MCSSDMKTCGQQTSTAQTHKSSTSLHHPTHCTKRLTGTEVMCLALHMTCAVGRHVTCTESLMYSAHIRTCIIHNTDPRGKGGVLGQDILGLSPLCSLGLFSISCCTVLGFSALALAPCCVGRLRPCSCLPLPLRLHRPPPMMTIMKTTMIYRFCQPVLGISYPTSERQHIITS